LPNRRQRYVQCWHGTPLKKIGFDIEYCDNSLNSVTEFREKYLSNKIFDILHIDNNNHCRQNV